VLRHAVLCCAMLCCAAPCCAVLRHAVLRHAVLCCAMLCCAVLCRVLLQIVNKMSMLDNGRAQIEWTLTGQLSAFAVNIPIRSVFELNLLTGRVINHT
jgi:hypothetical protein